MRSESNSTSGSNDDENNINKTFSNNDRDSRIGAYCTLRSRNMDKTPLQRSSSGSAMIGTTEENRGKTELEKYCTIGRRLKKKTKTNNKLINSLDSKIPYNEFHNTTDDDNIESLSCINYGLSNDLSSESIKNACDFIDLSGDDDDDADHVQGASANSGNQQIEHVEAINSSLLQNIEQKFPNLKRLSMGRSSTKLSTTFDRGSKENKQFHPYCTIRRDNNNPIQIPHIIDNNQRSTLISGNSKSKIYDQQDQYHKNIEFLTSLASNRNDSIEAMNILSELDAILDNHETIDTISPSSSSSPSIRNEPEKVEDYLLELDTYLEQIDRISLCSTTDGHTKQHHNEIIDTLQNNNDQITFIQQNANVNNFNNNSNINNNNNNNNVATTTYQTRTLPKALRNNNLTSSSAAKCDLINSSTFSSRSEDQRLNAGTSSQDHHYNIIDNRNNHNEQGDGCLRRGNHFRNTIAAVRPRSDRTAADHTNQGNTKENQLKSRHRSWRRHSMRKTSPIILPDHQKDSSTIISSQIPSPSSSHETHISDRLAEQYANCDTDLNELIPSSQQVVNGPTPTIPQRSVLLSTNDDNEFSNLNSINTDKSPHTENNTSPDDQYEDRHRRCLSEANQSDSGHLTHLLIINDILNHSSQDPIETGTSSNSVPRPRQLGRRAEARPRVVSIMAETSSAGSQRIIVNHDRPMSAPVAQTNRTTTPNSLAAPLTSRSLTENRRYIGSETSSVGSSRNPSPVSIVSSTASSSMVSASAEPVNENTSSVRQRNQQSDSSDESRQEDDSDNRIKEPQWPHGFSRTLALLCCTLGLFNISRFSLFSIYYGANFLVQFLILSIVFGIPLFWLQMCLGAKIKRGPVSMWKISPICKGIGISLVVSQCVIALYSAISLGWILVYFKDSFSSNNDQYKWQEPFELYRGPGNSSNRLAESVADYFNGVVLQRFQLGPAGRVGPGGGIRFQLAFNLAILWTIVFVVLCKGLKSFGRIALGLTLLPLILFIAVCSKLLCMIDFSSVQNIFPATDWPDFFLNSRSWLSAAQETFLTWGLLGASVIAMCSKSGEKSEGKTILRRDAFLVVILTLFGLFLAAIFGNACIQILQNAGYSYFPGSFESIETYTFLYEIETRVPPQFISTPPKWLPRYSTVMGEYFRRPGMNPLRESGYQALRLVTEIFPATLAAATQEFISPVWSLLGYLMLLMFGLAQLCAMWKPISSALGNSTSSVLLSCVTGLLLGIPLATEMGLSIIHYLDIIIGGSWWILILWSAQIFAVFLIRGRPYNSDLLVNDLHMTQTLSAFLAVSWNLLLPIGLISLSIIEYKSSNTREFYHWRGNSYYHLWTRKIGGFVQIAFLLLVPITSIIQIYRYLTTGPPDILDRIQLLYRPTQSSQSHHRNRSYTERPTYQTQPAVGVTLTSLESQPTHDDAPPKYTPPPSYTTATGARLAKILRQSIRRSVRRILGEPSRSRPTIRPGSNIGVSDIESSLPPAYSTVLSNPSGEDSTQLEIGPRALYNSHTQRSFSLERHRHPAPPPPPSASTSVPSTTPAASPRTRSSQTFSAFDVAQLLRTSHRHERSASTISACVDHVLKSSLKQKLSRSAENLVLNAAPLGESSIVTLNRETMDDENTSVI